MQILGWALPGPPDRPLCPWPQHPACPGEEVRHAEMAMFPGQLPGLMILGLWPLPSATFEDRPTTAQRPPPPLPTPAARCPLHPQPLTIDLQPGGLLCDTHGVAGLAGVGASIQAPGPPQLQLPAAPGIDSLCAEREGGPVLEPGDVRSRHSSGLTQEPHRVALHDGHLACLVGAPDGGRH